MNVHISREGIQIDGRQLALSATQSDMIELLGIPISTRTIPMHPRGQRVANVSSSGLVWYVDLPEDETSHLYIAIRASETPEKPPADFQGTVLFDGKEVNQETSESAFARLSPNAIPDHGHWWKLQTATHSLVLMFARATSRKGKRTSTRYLATISIGFPRS